MTSCDRKFSHIVVNTDDDVMKHPSACTQNDCVVTNDIEKVPLQRVSVDDLSVEPMSRAQKLVIGAAVLFLAVFVAYYVLILH